jgi:hypothetical protein
MARLDFEAASLELQQYRQSGERASERVAYLASRIIKDGYSAKLKDDSKNPWHFTSWSFAMLILNLFQYGPFTNKLLLLHLT